MIDILPVPYKDELFYSWLARCYVKNCYPDYKIFSSQIMGRASTNPSFEFVNKITEAELDNMKRVFSGGIKKIINEHTLLPYYVSFIDEEIRSDIYSTAGKANLRFDKLLGLPKGEHTRFLKFCPICAKEDRERWGEAYWHRRHQIIDIKACPDHRVCLVETNIAMNEKLRWTLFSAELEIDDNVSTSSASEKEIIFARYASELLDWAGKVEINSSMTAGKYLSLRMLGTKYVTIRGNKRHVKLLNSDLNEFWQREIPLYKMKKVLRGLTNQTNEVVYIAIMLGVSPLEMLLKLNANDEQIKVFDKKVMDLYNKGKTDYSIAYTLNVSFLTVRRIIENELSENNKNACSEG